MRKLKIWKMRHTHCRSWNLAINSDKREKSETHIVRPGIWRETVKNVINEKYTQNELEYGEKIEKLGK